MSTEENKAMIRRVGEVFNQGDLAVVDEVMAADYVHHGPFGEFKGPEGFKQMVTMFRTAFPDLNMTIEDMVAEGDKVASRLTLRGTHKGEYMGIAATGKQVTVTEIVISRFAGGKEVEAWGSPDLMGMMQQLGVVPPMGQA